jgi:hypothetical protein
MVRAWTISRAEGTKKPDTPNEIRIPSARNTDQLLEPPERRSLDHLQHFYVPWLAVIFCIQEEPTSNFIPETAYHN